MACNDPIGVFDSGVGGLTVAREIMKQLPGERIVYFGDTARVPYGSKSKETIITYSKQIVKFLQSKKAKAIVVGCNTVSAVALDEIKAEVDIPVVDVVRPGAKQAAETTKNGKIGIIGTERTISSGIYSEYLSETNPQVKVFGKACPLIVPLVEEGWLEDPVTVEVVKRYISELKDFDIDTLVMGCTHYPLIGRTIQTVMGDRVTLVNPAFETAKKLKEVLEASGLSCGQKEVGAQHLSKEEGNNHKFYVSDGAEKFKDFANSILPCEVIETKDINIELY